MRTKKPTKRIHGGERKIHFLDAVWTYRIGGGGCVRIRDPNGFTTSVGYAAVTGWDQETVNRGIWKRYFAVRPSDIKAYIEKNLTIRTK